MVISSKRSLSKTALLSEFYRRRTPSPAYVWQVSRSVFLDAVTSYFAPMSVGTPRQLHYGTEHTIVQEIHRGSGAPDCIVAYVPMGKNLVMLNLIVP